MFKNTITSIIRILVYLTFKTKPTLMQQDSHSTVNSGVHSNVGMGFQKNCAVYLFLENYNKLNGQRYFIILEHVEDIVFGYLDENELLSKLESYQAKKSGKQWSQNACLKIIKQIVNTAQLVLEDDHLKTDDFYQENYFATNNSIELKEKPKKPIYKCLINETNSTVAYKDLHQNIQNKIAAGNKEFSFNSTDKNHFQNLHFKFIDLPRKSDSQIQQLTGKFREVFKDSILDHNAALKTFLGFLHELESTFNEGNIAKLKDKSKRIESYKIDKLLNILTTKKLAYDFWRNKGEVICEELNISISEIQNFKLHYLNSFDEFKDLKESEHQKVYAFVGSNKQIFDNHTTDRKCIVEFVEEFGKKKMTTLREVQLKAVISAAYLEIKSTLFYEDKLRNK